MWPSESNAPALTSDSMVRLLQTTAGTLRRKSSNEVNAPFSSRVRTIASTTLWPTLRMAARPNRTSSPTAANTPIEALTSGGRTVTCIRRHSPRYSADLSLSSPTEVSSAAMYSAL